MMAAQKEKGGKKQQAPALDARREMSKTKEQVEEEMKISLSIRIKPLDLDAMDSDDLKSKAHQLWTTILSLETDKYDYEQRRLAQDYELKELKERQKIQLRNKAIKKGLDPEAFTGKHPPKIRMFSKYERRTDTRTYGDRKKLYEGGWEVVRAEMLEAMWKETYEDWTKRPKSKLPKWFGERPGKKSGDPETPEGEEEEAAAANVSGIDDDEDSAAAGDSAEETAAEAKEAADAKSVEEAMEDSGPAEEEEGGCDLTDVAVTPSGRGGRKSRGRGSRGRRGAK